MCYSGRGVGETCFQEKLGDVEILQMEAVGG